VLNWDVRRKPGNLPKKINEYFLNHTLSVDQVATMPASDLVDPIMIASGHRLRIIAIGRCNQILVG
jgi:hypothetical protein